MRSESSRDFLQSSGGDGDARNPSSATSIEWFLRVILNIARELGFLECCLQENRIGFITNVKIPQQTLWNIRVVYWHALPVHRSLTSQLGLMVEIEQP